MRPNVLDQLPAAFTFEDAKAAGLSRYRLSVLVDAGTVASFAHGLYRRNDVEDVPDLGLFEIAKRQAKSTLCLTSALVHHGLSDALAPSIDVAVPIGSYTPHTVMRVSWHRYEPDTFEVGRETMPVDERTDIGVYSPERCVLDTFRYRWHIADDRALDAMRRWREKGGSPEALLDMAARFPAVVEPVTAALHTLH